MRTTLQPTKTNFWYTTGPVGSMLCRSFFIGILILLAGLAVTESAYGQTTRTSVRSGNWSNKNTWSGNTVPGSNDNVVIAAGHTISFNGARTMKNLTINAGATVTDNGQSTTITGDITVNGTYKGSGDIRLTGKGGTIAGIGTITNTGDIVIEGDKTISAGARLSKTSGDIQINGGSAVENNGTLTLTGNITGGTLWSQAAWVNAENAALTLGGNFGLTVALNASAAGNTITYSGSNVLLQIIRTPIDGQYANLTFSGTSFKYLPAEPIYISGDFVNDCRYVIQGSGSVTFNGMTTISGSADAAFNDVNVAATLIASPGTLLVSGNFTNEGTFVHSGGTLQFNGNGTAQVNGNALVLHNVTVDASKTVRNNTAIDLRGVLNLSSSATFEANGNGTGTLTLRSFSESTENDASIGPLLGGARVTGNVKVERYMRNAARIYRYLSSPVKNATLAEWSDDFVITGYIPGLKSSKLCGYSINAASPSIYYYDETGAGDWSNGYMPFPSSGGAGLASVIQTGRGYAAFIRNCTEVVIDVTGEINQGDVSFDFVSYTESKSDYDGYNLVGNPYPSAIDWGNRSAWTRNNIALVAAVTRNLPNGKTQFEYRDSSPDEFGRSVTNEVIASGQGFWVRALRSGASMTITENAKTTATSSFYRDGVQSSELVISVTDGTVTDKAFTRYRPFAETSLDEFDGVKLKNQTFDVFTYSTDGAELAINSTPAFGCNEPIKVGIRNLAAGTYTLAIDALGKYGQLKYELHDAFTGETIAMDQLAYEFSVTGDPASMSSSRFILYPREKDVEVPVELEYAPVICGPVASITLANSIAGVTYEIYNASDSLIASVTGNGARQEYGLPASILTSGEHHFNVRRVLICGGSAEATAVITVGRTPASWSVTGGKTCGEGSVKMIVTGAAATDNVRWFRNETDLNAVSEGSVFSTGSIGKNATFYAEVASAEGCVSGRVPALAEVVYVGEPEIVESGAQELKTAAGEVVNWYVGDEFLVSAASIIAEKTGVYTAEMTKNGCSARASHTFVIANAPESPSSFTVYPNPFVDYIIIPELGKNVSSVVVRNGAGAEIVLRAASVDDDGHRFDTSALPAGLYMVKINRGSTTSWEKLMKN